MISKVVKPLLVLSLLCIVMLVQAQVSTGVRAGFGFSTIEGSNIEGKRAITNFSGGVFGQLPLSGRVALQTELNIARRGMRGLSANGVAYRLAIDELELPILLKLQPSPTFFIFEMGLSVNRILSATQTSGERTNNVSTFFEPYNISAIGGIAHHFVSKDVHLGLRLSATVTNPFVTKMLFGHPQSNELLINRRPANTLSNIDAYLIGFEVYGTYPIKNLMGRK